MTDNTTPTTATTEATDERIISTDNAQTINPILSFIKNNRFGNRKSISEKAAETLVKTTQSSLTEVHTSTMQATSNMVTQNADAISKIGVAHESKASEAIEAIERMHASAQNNTVQVSHTTNKNIFSSLLMVVAFVGGAISIITNTKK